jgi:hypothetical protein
VDSASSTFDFSFRGDLILGDIDDDTVINLGSSLGPDVDLTISGFGTFVIGGVVEAVPNHPPGA